MSSLLVKGVVRDGRVEVEQPIDLPNGTEVLVTQGMDEGPASSEEIERILAAMHRLRPLEIPDEVSADLDAWERRLSRHGIDDGDEGVEDVFR